MPEPVVRAFGVQKRAAAKVSFNACKHWAVVSSSSDSKQSFCGLCFDLGSAQLTPTLNVGVGAPCYCSEACCTINTLFVARR